MKTTYLILLLLLTASCSKPQQELITVTAFFNYNIVCDDDFAVMELDIDGYTHKVKPFYSNIALKTELFSDRGGTITRAEVFNSKGERTYYSRNWEDRGSENGAIVVSLPYEFNDHIVLQFWCEGGY